MGCAGCWSSDCPWGQCGLSPTKLWWLQLCDVPDATGLVLGVCTSAGCPMGWVPCPLSWCRSSETCRAPHSHSSRLSGVTSIVGTVVTARCRDTEPVQGTLGFALSLEQVGVPGWHLQTLNGGLLSFSPGSVLGFAPCLSLPPVEKGQQSCPCAGMPSSSGAPYPCVPSPLGQGDSLSPEPPASSSSFQPERIKEGSEKINKHAGKTQTD